MNKDCQDFLNLRVKPALSGTREASWVLGTREDWIPILVSGDLVPVAGGHRPGCQFFFSTATLIRLAEDPEWADRAVALVRKTFQKRNRAGQQNRGGFSTEAVASAGGSHA